jgi:hypothetical protein
MESEPVDADSLFSRKTECWQKIDISFPPASVRTTIGVVSIACHFIPSVLDELRKQGRVKKRQVRSFLLSFSLPPISLLLIRLAIKSLDTTNGLHICYPFCF